MSFDYEFLLRIQAPRPVVFEKLLRIEHLARWFSGWARIDPKVGGTFTFGGETCIVLPEGRGWATTIDEGEPLRRFAFTWPILGAPTRVAYDLEDDGETATRVRTRHTRVPIRESSCGTLREAWRVCLGNLKAIAEGRSDGVRPDHSPIELPEVRLATIVDAPRERVFAALTDPSQIDHWVTGGLPGGNVRLEPRPGGELSLGWERGPNRVLEIERDRRLVLGWPSEWGDLRIAFDLETKASGTAVYLTSRGYGPGRTHDVLLDRGGWSDHLTSLRNLVESGEAGFLNPYADQVRDA